MTHYDFVLRIKFLKNDRCLKIVTNIFFKLSTIFIDRPLHVGPTWKEMFIIHMHKEHK